MCHIELSHVMQLLSLQSEGSARATAVGILRRVRRVGVVVPECVREGSVLSWGHTLLGQGNTQLSLESVGVR